MHECAHLSLGLGAPQCEARTRDVINERQLSLRRNINFWGPAAAAAAAASARLCIVGLVSSASVSSEYCTLSVADFPRRTDTRGLADDGAEGVYGCCV